MLGADACQPYLDHVQRNNAADTYRLQADILFDFCSGFAAFTPLPPPRTIVPMPYRCLTDFLEELGHAGELTRVEDQVDPALEAAEIVARSAKSGGPALLFGAVKGHDLPVLCNLLGTEGRICRALGVASLDEVADRIGRLFDAASPEGWFERLKGGSQPAALASVAPRKVKSAAAQQIVRLGSDINLGELPLLQAAPEEPGRAITAAPVCSRPSPIHTARWPAGSISCGSTARGWRSAGPRTTNTPDC